MKRILDKDFVYVPAEKQGPDYLKEKFARIRREYEEKKAREEAEQRLKKDIHIVQMKRQR